MLSTRLLARSLTALMLLGATMAFTWSFGVGAADAAPGQPQVAVHSSPVWTRTGIQVRAGETIVINATGVVKFRAPSSTVGPGGVPWGSACKRENVRTVAAPWPASGVACWSLIGRIGSGDPFEVGRSSRIAATTSGELELGINDNYIADNAGSWNASVVVIAGAPLSSSTPATKHGSSPLLFVLIGCVVVAVIAGLLFLARRARRHPRPPTSDERLVEAAAAAVSARSPSTDQIVVSLLPTADDQTIVPSEHDETKVNIFEVTVTTATLRVGYSRFPEGVEVQWSIRRGVRVQDAGSFVTNGGGDTEHYVAFPIAPPPDDGRGASVEFHWSIDDVPFAYGVRRDVAAV